MPKTRDKTKIMPVLKYIIESEDVVTVGEMYRALISKINYRTFLRVVHDLGKKNIVHLVKKGGGKSQPVYLELRVIDRKRAKAWLNILKKRKR